MRLRKLFGLGSSTPEDEEDERRRKDEEEELKRRKREEERRKKGYRGYFGEGTERGKMLKRAMDDED